MTTSDTTAAFRALHAGATFVLPNAWDVGSARILQTLGFAAIATTSSGLAAALGRADTTVTRDELVRHVAAVVAAVDVPVSVDAERAFPDDPGGVERTVDLLAQAGAAGLSVEDFDPTSGRIVDLAPAVDAVARVVAAAARSGLVVTARAENHIHDRDDLEDTIARLLAYQEAGADVLYAPGLVNAADIGRVVAAVGAPVNVLALPGVPPVEDLARLGVARVSTGGGLAWTAYGALVDVADELRRTGRYAHLSRGIDPAVRERAWG